MLYQAFYSQCARIGVTFPCTWAYDFAFFFHQRLVALLALSPYVFAYQSRSDGVMLVYVFFFFFTLGRIIRDQIQKPRKVRSVYFSSWCRIARIIINVASY